MGVILFGENNEESGVQVMFLVCIIFFIVTLHHLEQKLDVGSHGI